MKRLLGVSEETLDFKQPIKDRGLVTLTKCILHCYMPQDSGNQGVEDRGLNDISTAISGISMVDPQLCSLFGSFRMCLLAGGSMSLG